jgi:hypothetical protein
MSALVMGHLAQHIETDRCRSVRLAFSAGGILDFSEEFLNSLVGRFTLFEFHRELQHFLGSHGIVRLPDPATGWYHLIEVVFCHLVEDRPLEVRAATNPPPRHVNRITLHLQESDPAKDRGPDVTEVFPFMLHWKFWWDEVERFSIRGDMFRRKRAEEPSFASRR